MERRDALRAMGAGVLGVGLAGSVPAADKSTRLWVPVLRTGVRSGNGNLYPREAVARVLPDLGLCRVFRKDPAIPPASCEQPDGSLVWSEAMGVVGHAWRWRLRAGWLEAECELSPDSERAVLSGDLVARPSLLATARHDRHVWDEDSRGTPGEWRAWRTVLEIAAVDHLSLMPPDEASWPDLGVPTRE